MSAALDPVTFLHIQHHLCQQITFSFPNETVLGSDSPPSPPGPGTAFFFLSESSVPVGGTCGPEPCNTCPAVCPGWLSNHMCWATCHYVLLLKTEWYPVCMAVSLTHTSVPFSCIILPWLDVHIAPTFRSESLSGAVGSYNLLPDCLHLKLWDLSACPPKGQQCPRPSLFSTSPAAWQCQAFSYSSMI